MLEKPQSREDILEHCHNEIVKIIVEHKLLASDIILILELIKNSIIKQLSNRYYVQSIPKTTKIPVSIQPHKLAEKEELPNKTKEMSPLPKETKIANSENPSTS